MPTYQYRCSDCGHDFDIYQSFSADTLTECPNCGGAIRRVIQPVGVVFKGSGFYINDSRKSESSTTKSEPAKSDVSKSDPAKSEGDKPASTETKSEPKSESKEPAKSAKTALETKPAASTA